jgi:extracellular factor (EF) 3-hydroxypalmitic acid methyl ester biosynthesis protein
MEIMSTKAGDTVDRWVMFDHGQGTEVGRLMRLTRHVAVFETYAPSGALQVSQVLGAFEILVRARLVYSGRAVVHHLINTGFALACEVSLDDTWLDIQSPGRAPREQTVAADFLVFFENWKRSYQIAPEYKMVLSDLRTFLWDLRSWLDQVEVEVEAEKGVDVEQKHREIVGRLVPEAGRALDAMVERFELLAAGLSAELRPSHKAFLQRQLHSLILCSPFARRAYSKPLGYAGDFEMVRMIAGDPCVGPSLFAKLLNCWFLGQAPAQAHRNRLTALLAYLRDESIRVSRWSRPPRIVSLGCGPALEVGQFLSETALGYEPEFSLIDFNQETLRFVDSNLAEVCRRHGRHAVVRTIHRSVSQLLKEGGRARRSLVPTGCDLVYCAGLFDYLTEEVCGMLLRVLYELLLPGGLLLVTNVDASLNSSRGFRNSMEYMLDWNLVFRTGRQLEALSEGVVADAREWRVESDPTGVNNFLSIRKPEQT